MSGLAARFELERGAFTLDVGFELPTCGVTTLSGPSGSGKTTILRCMAGLERPRSGSLRLDGDSWFDSDRGLDRPPHRRAVGYVTQTAHLFTHLDVRDNLLFGLRRVRERAPALTLERLAEPLGLLPLLDRDVANLSGGERQRVAIGRALLASPRLLLLDEPVSALDLAAKGEVLEAIERVLSDLTVPCVYVSHDLREAARLADRMIWLDGGRILAQGPVREVISNPRLPFAQDEDAESLLIGKVTAIDHEAGLACVGFSGGELWIAAAELPRETEVRVQIRARDVSIALERPKAISVLNILPGTITDLVQVAAAPSQVLVSLEVGESRLLSRITRRSASELGLTVGLRAWALVKSAAITK